LGNRLRGIRLNAGLTGVALAEAAGWHRTKVSKLEAAATSPSVQDIRSWCLHCDALDQVEELTEALLVADTMWTDWRRLEKTGLRPAQEAVLPLWERTRRFRIYSSWLVPGPVQAEPYIQALLTATRDRRRLADDVEETTAVRVAKQHVIHEGDHRFAIVLEEAVLRYRIGGPQVLAAQLRHLLEIMTLPSISLGIIPLDADRTVLRPVEMFFMFDTAQVSAEFVSGWLRVTTPSEIAMYAEAFALLSSTAVYGTHAQNLIGTALDALN
jgi:transcriptional regulator with XRE-family HTH domain